MFFQSLDVKIISNLFMFKKIGFFAIIGDILVQYQISFFYFEENIESYKTKKSLLKSNH
jgi:hypothetical protein